MSRKRYFFTVPEPCHENWYDMAPKDNGKFCEACQKTVIDFTVLSDSEILDILKKGNACGRFSSEQLNRPLTVVQGGNRSWKYLLITAMLGLAHPAVRSFAGKPLAEASAGAKNQSRKKTAPCFESEKDTINVLKWITISGRVIDAKTRLPLPGVWVKVYYGNKGSISLTVSDSNGWYSFEVSDCRRYKLVCTIYDYKDQTVIWAKGADVKMHHGKSSMAVMGAVGHVITPQEHFMNKIRTFFRRVFFSREG